MKQFIPIKQLLTFYDECVSLDMMNDLVFMQGGIHEK